MDSSPGQVIGTARDVTPPGGRRSRRRRRPTGEPPPLPRHLETTGVGWLVAAVGLIALSLLVFTAGRYGRGVSFTVVDNWVLEWLAARRSPGLTSLMRGLTEVLGTIWTIKVLAWFTVIVLVVYKRFRHLVVGLVSVQLVSLVVVAPLGGDAQAAALRGGHRGKLGRLVDAVAARRLPVRDQRDHALQPGPQGALAAGRQVGRHRAGQPARGRPHVPGRRRPQRRAGRGGDRGDHPAAGLPLVRAQRGLPGQLPAGPQRPPGRRRGPRAGHPPRPADQLGLEIEEVKPFGLAGSAGSTPLRIKVKGDPGTVLFGKLYARSHLRSDRWYKLGRELLYGRLEDEKPFHSVRRLVQQEDYALHKLHLAGLPSPRPYGFVELTPDREYLLVTEFFDGAVELGEAEVDEAVIDDGLGIVRKLWDAGLAHRDVKPANLLVRDGRMLLIDVAFVESRPTPWREAVDLANMMLCLALRSDPELVYERALRQFTVQEITEAFAATRGLAMPSQLRHMLRAQGRDLHAEFLDAAARTAPPDLHPALQPAADRAGHGGPRSACWSSFPWW